MVYDFFEHPILNSPYEYPARHWELDEQGQPTRRIIESRRNAEYFTPIPKPKKQKATVGQARMIWGGEWEESSNRIKRIIVRYG
ncbi:MAG: hypothetical protein JXA46_18985 [Dehalococcoidales bacterium]|nr:hypothetical protein [Dehalococcoidales bacterium]